MTKPYTQSVAWPVLCERNESGDPERTMAVVVEKSDAVSRIALEGTIDISVAAELKTTLQEAVDAGKPIAVSLAAASYLDVTAVQLLWAARRAAQDARVTLTIEDAPAEPVAAALTEAGFAVPVAE